MMRLAIAMARQDFNAAIWTQQSWCNLLRRMYTPDYRD